MNKEEMDIQLIEACVLEKWNPRAMGCKVGGKEGENCSLCQVYLARGVCYGCPILERTRNHHCNGTPFTILAGYEYDRIEAEVEFLISLLPENHPWRTR